MLSSVSFLIGLLRVVVVLFALRLLLRGVAALFRQSPRPRKPAPALGEEMVRDQICNTFLPKKRALREVIGGEERFFCSSSCRDEARRRFARAS
jgi:hypothetical protein